MKKTILGFLLLILVLSLCGCNSNSGSNDENVNNKGNIEYISDRKCSYYSENEEYIVFFGLQDNNNNYLDASGTAEIVIVDDNNIEIFEKSIQFSESDFTDWSNAMRDYSRYLCGIHIKRSEISGSTTKSGKLKLTVYADDVSFDESSMIITDLPSKSVNITLPSTPQTIKNYDYSGNLEFEAIVENITCSTESNYDGKSTATFVITTKMTKNNSKYSASYFYVGYKLKNSKGIVVKSEKTGLPSVGVGETVQDDFIIFDLDPTDSYVLEFTNPEF